MVVIRTVIQGSKVKCESSTTHDNMHALLAKLTVDYSEDRKSSRIALSAKNNAFGVHSNHVQPRSSGPGSSVYSVN